MHLFLNQFEDNFGVTDDNKNSFGWRFNYCAKRY